MAQRRAWKLEEKLAVVLEVLKGQESVPPPELWMAPVTSKRSWLFGTAPTGPIAVPILMLFRTMRVPSGISASGTGVGL